jgi:hypothetical protein
VPPSKRKDTDPYEGAAEDVVTAALAYSEAMEAKGHVAKDSAEAKTLTTSLNRLNALNAGRADVIGAARVAVLDDRSSDAREYDTLRKALEADGRLETPDAGTDDAA